MNMMNNGTHLAPSGIKLGSPASNNTTPNTNAPIMQINNSQSMPQAPFAAFASSFDPTKMYGKTNTNASQAFWNPNAFAMPINMGSDGE